MELATNTFTKGLLSDTNPMITGNDVMTDCLNGTLITMNGNEIMLLNDMGNRRVNNAFLPSGYLPVGMKEYGGIIYIAAYNPITNKSLIGSFPSPLKKFDFEDTKQKEFKFEKFFKEKDDGESEWNIEVDPDLGIRILKSDSFMISLTDDLNLRAGDKFTIYSSDLYDSPLETETYLIKDSEGNIINTVENKYYAKDLITNFLNAEDRKAKNKKAITPKNRKYTLSVGVLNSQNEFVDITRSLCRWDEDKMINYDSSYSDIYKFNDGYFIAKSFSNGDLSETINDAKLIKTRQKIATNTYAYKLVGPMYLKISLNHVESFRYNVILEEVEEVPDGDNVVLQGKVVVEGYITYNCPDGVDIFSPNDGNENYKTFQLGKTKLNGFDFFQISEKGEIVKLTPDLEGSGGKECVYDSASNTYSLKIVKTYTKIIADNGGIFNYVLGVNVGTTDDLYLKGLSTKGFLNFGLYGSGAIMFQTWKFYNDINKKESTLRYSLLAYPKRNLAFTDFRFKFIDLENREKEITFNAGDYYNDTIILNWDSLDFEFKKVYLVKLLYNVYDVESEKVTLTNQTIADISGNIESKSLYISQEEEEFIPTETSFDIPSYRCEGTTKILEKTKHTLVTNSKTNELYWKVDSNSIEEAREENSFDCGCYACRITLVGGKVVDVPKNNYTDEGYEAFVMQQLAPYSNVSLIEKLEINDVNPSICFYRLPTLKTIIFQSGNIHIGSGVELVVECPKLKSIQFTEGQIETNFNEGGSSALIFGDCEITSLTFPESLGVIKNLILTNESDESGDHFKRIIKPSITTLKFGPNMTSFPERGFFERLTDSNNNSYLNKLEDVYCLTDNVLYIGRDRISITHFGVCVYQSHAKWHVPESCVGAYQDAINYMNNSTSVEIVALTQEDIDLYKSEIYNSKINSESQELTNQDSEEQLDGPNEPYSEKSNNCRWFLTTGLFNNFFNDPSVLDFCNTSNEDFKSKMTINLDLNIKAENEVLKAQATSTGKLYSTEGYGKQVEYIKNNKNTIKCNILKSSFKNLSLYPYLPDNCDLKFNNIYRITLNNLAANSTNFNSLLSENLGNKFLGYFSFNNNKATGVIEWQDKCRGTTDTEISNANLFISLSKALNNIDNKQRLYGDFFSKITIDGELHENVFIPSTGDYIAFGKLDIDSLNTSFGRYLKDYKNLMYLDSPGSPYYSLDVFWITDGEFWVDFLGRYAYIDGVPTEKLVDILLGLNSDKEIRLEPILDFLLRKFKYDLIYNYSNEYKIFICKSSSYLYGKYDNGINVKILLPVKISEFYINYYNIGNLQFDYTLAQIDPINVEFKIFLSLEFLDKIESTADGNVSIYKSSTKEISEDYKGDPLNRKTIYYEEKDLLYPALLQSVTVIHGDNNNLIAIKSNKLSLANPSSLIYTFKP